MTNRNQYFDFIRGIAILMVIAIHTFPQSDVSTQKGAINLILRQIAGSPVPLFLAISGFFLGGKILDTKEQRLTFWKKQIPKVYIPVLIWSLPLLFLSIKNGENLIISIIRFFGCGYSIYYFIALIIQCYIFLPMLQKIQNRRFFCILTYLISTTCVFFISWFDFNRFPLVVYAGPIVTWIMFFYMGIILSKERREKNIRYLSIFIGLSIILCIAESYMLYHCCPVKVC